VRYEGAEGGKGETFLEEAERGGAKAVPRDVRSDEGVGGRNVDG
jgi:hypothetical protein